MAHGLAVQAIRASAKKLPNIGLAENVVVCVPAIETDEHIAAARRAMRELNAHFITAVMEGKYDQSYLKAEGADAPVFTAAEMKIIGSPMDFLGLNMYAPTYIRAAPETPSGFQTIPHPQGYPRMQPDWLFICPQIAYWGPRLANEIWKPKAMCVTENGCASLDRVTPEGEIYDTDRVMYLRNHLINAHRAVREKLPLKGYFLWSLLDNFEWARGYTQRFGITYCELFHTEADTQVERKVLPRNHRAQRGRVKQVHRKLCIACCGYSFNTATP